MKWKWKATTKEMRKIKYKLWQYMKRRLECAFSKENGLLHGTNSSFVLHILSSQAFCLNQQNKLRKIRMYTRITFSKTNSLLETNAIVAHLKRKKNRKNAENESYKNMATKGMERIPTILWNKAKTRSSMGLIHLKKRFYLFSSCVSFLRSKYL